jgi:hypothetical protein
MILTVDVTMHPLITSTLGQLPIQALNTRELYRSLPFDKSASLTADQLGDAYMQRVADIAPDADVLPVRPVSNTPPSLEELTELVRNNPGQLMESIPNPALMAGNESLYVADTDGNVNAMTSPRTGANIYYNPNVDEVYLAHELGHSASTHTKIGDQVRRIRDALSSNPKLAMALAAAGGIAPLGAAVLTPGDDDLDEAILGSLALSSPILIDEALASKNALAIMEQAGNRASLGQRGKLAGGYLSYLAAPIGTAVLANTVGNQFDQPA